MVEDVLAADLRQRLPSSLIQKQQDYLQPKNALYLETEIERFDRDDQAILQAQIVVEDKHCLNQKRDPVSFHVKLESDASREGFDQLIGELADRVVEQVRAQTKNSCPQS
jgi:hypothetical protein